MNQIIEYAILDKSGAIVERRWLRELTPSEIKHWLGLPLARPIETTKPSFDLATQIMEVPVITILPDKVTEVFTVRAKTAQEIAAEQDAIKEASLDRFDLVALKIAFNHENRIRVLEAKPQVTVAQFRAALKALL